MTTALKESQYGLAGELIDDLERAATIGRTGIIAQIQKVVFGQELSDAVKDGEASVAGIENAYGAGWGNKMVNGE